MTRNQWVLLTLVSYQVVLVAIGLWASRRTRDAADFFLGGRRLGGLVAAISASASSSSAWTLLGVSGAAYVWGISAIWLFPATVLGFVVNWTWVAPRLMRYSREDGSLTLTQFLAGGAGPLHAWVMRLGSAIIFFSFIFYIAAQFQAAGNAFASTFDLSMEVSILVGGGVIILYTLLGGFWAVSVTDTLQGLLMAGTALVLPVVALMAVGGWGDLWSGLAATGNPDLLSLTGPHAGLLALGFVAGTLGIGLGYPGQPHVVNRFMALRDTASLRQGRIIAIVWAVIIYSGMLLVGWCGRVLVTSIGDNEQIFFAVAGEHLSPVVSGIMIAAVLSAIMSTADSQLLVAASSVSHDLRRRGGGETGAHDLLLPRMVVLGISIVAILTALFLPEAIFSRVLFAWHAVGSAFGPVLLVRLAGGRPTSAVVLASMAAGFGLTVAFYLAPSAPGDFLERLLPFAVALGIALAGRRRA